MSDEKGNVQTIAVFSRSRLRDFCGKDLSAQVVAH